MKIYIFFVLMFFGCNVYAESNDKSKVIVEEVDWFDVSQKGVKELKFDEVVEGEAVSIVIHNFNFFKYAMEVDVSEKEIEVYASLEKLWKGVLLPDFSWLVEKSDFAPAARSRGERSPHELWWQSMISADKKVRDITGNYTKKSMKVYVNDKVADAQNTADVYLKDLMWHQEDMILRRDAVLNEMPADIGVVEFNEYLLKRHNVIAEKLSKAIKSATFIAKGKRINIPGKKSGTLVTLTISVKESTESGESSAPSFSDSYFVRSKYPFIFHFGPTYTSVDDIDFQKVAALDGREMFTQVSDNSSDTDFTAFLSYPVFPNTCRSTKCLLTMGTDVSDPGERLYFGVSFMRGKWALGIGYNNTKTIEAVGDGEVENNDGQSNTRILYESIKEKDEWVPFISISVNAF